MCSFRPIWNHKWHSETCLPTKFSKTELFPADCPPTTAICGKSSCIWTPNWVKASWSLFTIGINCSIPTFPVMAAGFHKRSSTYELHRRSPLTDFSNINIEHKLGDACANKKGKRWWQKIKRYRDISITYNSWICSRLRVNNYILIIN